MTLPKIRCHRQRRDLQKIITKQYDTTVRPRRGQIAKIMEWVPEGMGKVIFIGQVNETKGKENLGISKSLRGSRDPSKKQWDESRCAEKQREAEGHGGEIVTSGCRCLWSPTVFSSSGTLCQLLPLSLLVFPHRHNDNKQ